MNIKRWVVLFLLFIPIQLFSQTTDAGPCSKPKVIVMVQIGETALNHNLRIDFGEQPAELWNSELGKFAKSQIDSISENVDVSSIDEIYLSAENDKHYLKNHPEIQDALKSDYLFRIGIYQLGDNYQLYVYLTSIDSTIIAKMVSSNGRYLSDELQKAISKFGDLRKLIDKHEKKFPETPRDPKLDVTVAPEVLEPKKGKDSCTISVKVTDCRGMLTYRKFHKHKVFFERETRRGKVKTGVKSGYSLTRSNGVATATYHLDYSKGTGTGLDTVKIWTFGRGRKKYEAEAKIKIISDGKLKIEKSLGGVGCSYEKPCKVMIPFEVKCPDTSGPCEIEGKGSAQVPYKLVCGGNCFTGTFGAGIVGGKLDLEKDPEHPLSLTLKIWRDNEVHFMPSCENPILTLPRGERAQMDMALYSWPLVDGYSKRIGVFKYTLHFK